MAKLNSQNLSIEALDSILAGYKTDAINNAQRLALSSEFLYSYLQTLTASMLSDRVGMYKVLDVLGVNFTNTNSDSAINTVIINSKTIEDVCDGHGISPSEIDELITNKIQEAFNSYIYKLEEAVDNSSEEENCIKIHQGANPEVVLDNPEANSWTLLTTLKCKKPNFNKAIQIHDEFKKRFISGKVIEKEFIATCLHPFITKQNGESFSYDEFLATFQSNLVLAYEFLLYFVDLSYSGSFKKKR